MNEYTNQQDRNDYDVNSSQAAQDNFDKAAAALEAALDRRDQDVRNAMAEYLADGVSDQYQQLEFKWNSAGRDVRDVIKIIRGSLAQNDDVALAALSKAKSAIPSV